MKTHKLIIGVLMLAALSGCRTQKTVDSESSAVSDSLAVSQRMHIMTYADSIIRRLDIKADTLTLSVTYIPVPDEECPKSSRQSPTNFMSTVNLRAVRAQLKTHSSDGISLTANDQVTESIANSRHSHAHNVSGSWAETSAFPIPKVFVFTIILVFIVAVGYALVRRQRHRS